MQNVLERMEAIGAERKMADFNVKMKAVNFTDYPHGCELFRRGI